MIRALFNFTLPCIYLAQEKLVDRLYIPSLVIANIAVRSLTAAKTLRNVNFKMPNRIKRKYFESKIYWKTNNEQSYLNPYSILQILKKIFLLYYI
jgi:hypothetical protein